MGGYKQGMGLSLPELERRRGLPLFGVGEEAFASPFLDPERRHALGPLFKLGERSARDFSGAGEEV